MAPCPLWCLYYLTVFIVHFFDDTFGEVADQSTATLFAADSILQIVVPIVGVCVCGVYVFVNAPTTRDSYCGAVFFKERN